MSNGFAGSFNNRESSGTPSDAIPTQTLALTDTSREQFSNLRVHHENSLTTQLLPSLSISNNEAQTAMIRITGYQANQPYSRTNMSPFSQYANAEDYKQAISRALSQDTSYLKPSIADKTQPLKVEKIEPIPELSRTQLIMQALYARVNSEREKHGLEPLTSSEKLAKMALVNSKKMKSRGTVGHFAGFNVRENAAMAPVKSDESPEKIANRIVAMWMNSRGHRANLLNDRITKMGAGIDGKWDTLSLA